MLLNSYFSWNSLTLPCRRSFEKLSVSTSFSSSVTRPTMRVRLMTSSPTVFIMRSRRSSAMRTDFADCAGACDLLARFARDGRRRNLLMNGLERFCCGDLTGDGFFDFDRREFSDAIEQGIDAVAHLGFVCPLLMQRLF